MSYIRLSVVLALHLLLLCIVARAGVVDKYVQLSKVYETDSESSSLKESGGIAKSLAAFSVIRCKLDKYRPPFHQSTESFQNFLKKVETGDSCLAEAVVMTAIDFGSSDEKEATNAELLREKSGKVDQLALRSLLNKIYDACQKHADYYEGLVNEANGYADKLETSPFDVSADFDLVRASVPICRAFTKRNIDKRVGELTKKMQQDGFKQIFINAKKSIKARLPKKSIHGPISIEWDFFFGSHIKK